MKIDRITIAVTHMKEVVEFYNAVFDSELKPIAGLEGFYSGKLGGFDMLLCPNEIAGVVAEQNRHQFRFVVGDLDAVLSKGRAMGGILIDDAQANGTSKSQGMRDPDGNSMEFIQYL